MSDYVYTADSCDCCNVIIGYTVILDDDVHLSICEDCKPINKRK
jgi:hypothetical protein